MSISLEKVPPLRHLLERFAGRKRSYYWGTLAVFLLAAVTLPWLTQRFSIGVDSQQSTCLGYRIFIIDHADRTPERGKPFQFSAKSATPYFPDGTLMVKRMEGIPGDRITVSEQAVIVNGVRVGTGTSLAARLKKPASRFQRDEYLAAGKYWFMGTTTDSYDSRYWGTVDQQQLLGRAYPLW